MLKDVVEVRPLPGYRISVRFEDGVAAEIDVAALISFHGVFAPLKQPEFFRQVRVEPELGVVCWPNGADLDSDVLYAVATGQPVPDLTPEPAASG
jgi:hypothetical protein